MKCFLPCLLAAAFLAACGKPAASPGVPLGAPASAPTAAPTQGVSPTAAPMAVEPSAPTRRVASAPPTTEQKAKLEAAANQLRGRFQAGRKEAAAAHAQALAAWQAKQASHEKAMQAYMQAVKDHEAAVREREAQWAAARPKQGAPLVQPKELPPLPPPPSEPVDNVGMEPVMPQGDPKANQSFDALIYKFRQAVAARKHAEAAAVMAKMAEAAPKVSPSLLAIWESDAAAYLGSSGSAGGPAAP